MRQIPVDTAKLALIATGKIAPKPFYARQADGSSQMVKGKQATDESGAPLWVIDCLIDDGSDDEDGRAEVIGVTVASSSRPKVAKFTPVSFVDVVASIYRDKLTGQPKVSLVAGKIAAAAKVAA